MVLPPRNGLSLCAGAGGLDMGLMLAEPGFHTRCFVEWDDYPRQALIAAQRAGYFAPAPIWDDVTTFDAQPLAGCIDTLLAGYPCQPFSQAGQRKGEDDERHLWPDIERIIGELGPGLRWCFFENVAGHLTLGLETVLRSLRRLGFTPAVGVFSAEEVGAPHERQRVFIVAHRQGSDGRGQQPERGAGRGRPGPTGNGAELADPDGRHPGTERQQRGGEQRLHPPGRGASASRAGGRSMPEGTTITGQTPDGRKVTVGLENQAKMWGTPRGSDGEKGGPNMSFGAGGTPLPAQAANWPTPSAMQDTKGDADIGAIQKRELDQRQIALAHRARLFSRPAPETCPHGLPPSPHAPISRPLWALMTASHGRRIARRLWKARKKRRLNPLFVEWLMGWPPGHALCDCSATEFVRWQQDMRGALSALPTASAAWIWEPPQTNTKPDQLSLF